jgi:hypothetical protein
MGISSVYKYDDILGEFPTCAKKQGARQPELLHQKKTQFQQCIGFNLKRLFCGFLAQWWQEFYLCHTFTSILSGTAKFLRQTITGILAFVSVDFVLINIGYGMVSTHLHAFGISIA